MNNPNRNFQQPNNFNNQPNNFNNHPNSFNQPNQGFRGNNFNSHVNVPPQKSTGQWKTALAAGAAGAIGGMLLYEGTKAIIKNAAAPFNVGGKDYYWGNENYKQQNGMFMCSIPLEQLQNQRTKRDTEGADASTTTTTTTTSAPGNGNGQSSNNILQNVQFSNGDRPKNVVWSCRQGAEVCCGMNCCPNPQQNLQTGGGSSPRSSGPSIFSIILFILFTLLLLGCCTCALIYCFCKSLFSRCIGQDDGNKQYENHNYENDYPQQQSSYPMHNYPQETQQQYPSYPHGNQQQYPTYPSNQGGYPSNNQPLYPAYN